MTLKRWLPLTIIGWVAIQHLVLSDEAAFHFAELDLVAELGILVDFAAANDIRMRFKDAD